MKAMKVPKFENETDEVSWLYENREGLAEMFLQTVRNGQVRRGGLTQQGIRIRGESSTEDAPSPEPS